MKFLPIIKNGKRVYAGFWKRFCAGLADGIIILPVAFFLIWLEGFGKTLAMIIAIPSAILFAMYNVYFNARCGGTPGKLAVGIRITKPDGAKIGWSEAWKRSSVDLVFAAIILVAEMWGLSQIDKQGYASLERIARTQQIMAHAPVWYRRVIICQQIWMWGEVFVLLFNKRRRAFHDFIGGTVVVHKQFAE